MRYKFSHRGPGGTRNVDALGKAGFPWACWGLCWGRAALAAALELACLVVSSGGSIVEVSRMYVVGES